MEFLDRLERKIGWLSFPGLLRYYALFHVMVFLLQFVNPEIREILDFNKAKIYSGEVWRVVTFIFVTDRFGGGSAFALLFLFFMVMIAFMMSDALEGAWGVFRTSIFYYTGFLGLLAANFLYPQPWPGSGFFIYLSAFFAFSTLFPRHEFLMFFVIPVQVRWLAILIAGLTVLGTLSVPVYLGYLALGFANYIFMAAVPAIKDRKRSVDATVRRRKFAKGEAGGEVAFHLCAECGRTEASDPDLEFRMSADGKEYCQEHLQE